MTNQLPQIQINATDIRIVDGLYCLNDLHKASGNEPKHQPSNFLRNEQTIALIAEIESENNRSSNLMNAIKAVKGGLKQGTYACKELVYAYAMWISPKFHLTVIRTFDSMYNALAIPSTTLTADQAFQIKKAVEQKCKSNSVHFQTVWTALKNHFGKATYREIESKDFDEAMLFVESLELPQLALPQPTEQPFFLSKNMAREFSARLTHIYDLVDLLDDNKITRKIKQRSSSLEQFLIQYEKANHPRGIDLA